MNGFSFVRTTRWTARLAVIVILLSCAVKTCVNAGESSDRILRGIDLQGESHYLGETSGCQGVVVVFLSTECPISNRYIPSLNEIAGKDRVKPPVRVYGVISSPHVTREDAVAHSEKFKPLFPVLFDASGELKELLCPTHTPHCFLLSPRGQTLYDGAIDDRFAAINKAKSTPSHHYLKDAIQSLLKREKIAVTQTTPVGCPLEVSTPQTRDASVTFNRDIAPIFFTRCSVCHRLGESGPFPLLTYQDAVKHSAQIRVVTTEKIMPPWKPVSGFGRFREESHLSERQISMISEWIKSGMPEGPAIDLPPMPQFPTGWQLGEPDLILEMPQEFSIAADGDDLHQHFVIPTGLTKDRLVEAIEFRPGNAAVVHHAGFYLDVTGAARKLDTTDSDVGYGGGSGPQFYSYGKLRTWVPGMRPQRFPSGYGQLIRKETDIMIEIHYQRTGKPETDRSKLGIYFAPARTKQVVLEIQVMDPSLEIPIGAKQFHQRVSYTLPVQTTLLDVTPHLHMTGREVKAEARLPDGTVKPLIWITDWDFNWQGQYVFLDPIRLPAGTKIECDYYFDNSSGNLRNPHDPPQLVSWGDRSKDEMAMCQFFYTCDNLRDMQRSHQHLLDVRSKDRKPANISGSLPTAAKP
jgi:mono/diheme cytochrome c family protein